MDLDLTGKVAVVSGAGRGIGRSIAERFVAEGMKVVALDLIAPTDLDGATGLQCDVTAEDDVERAINATVEQHGRIDVLVNNAGINVEGLTEHLSLHQVRAAFDVNVIGTFLLSRAVMPTMKQARRGRIINAASFAAIVPSVGAGIYAASKAAVVQFTRALAGELGPWGITANSYAPGMIPTAMNGFATMPAERQEQLLDTLTLRRWGTADDVADLLCFLASDQSSYITGTLIDISGGKLATQIPSRAYPPAEGQS